jgi:hypothetical protein
MGLAIEVGMLAYFTENDPEGADWFRKSIALVNEVLAENGLPQHLEPDKLSIESHSSWGLPYSFLHHLRRFYARALVDPDWIPAPTPAGEDPTEDEVLDEEMYMFASHLLCHSDCGGFYIPIEFDEILVDDDKHDRIPGGLLGSSYRLMAELIAIAPKLGIELDCGHLSEAEAAKIDRECEAQTGLWIEKIVWLSLFEASRSSIKHKTAICFV